MQVPKFMVGPMKAMLKISIPITYVFMFVGAIMAVLSLVKFEWGAVLFSLLFIGFAVFHRFYCIRMLDSIERTGTTYKWRRKVD